MSAPFTKDVVAAARAWVLVLGRVKPADRRMVAIIAMADIGNLPVVTCMHHHGPYRTAMTITATNQHMTASEGATGVPCRLRFDLSQVEVES